MSASESIFSALSAITGTGGFHSTGTSSFFFPILKVEGMGEVAFPLSASQAKELIAVAEAAPYGLGEKTVLDETVRKCWQLDASRFELQSPQWKTFLEETVARVREDLGIAGKVSAYPYKLLVYGEGGHFKAHRDSEKLDAMFGTLIVALPSAHEGGRLFIRHDGREIVVDFSRQEHRHEFQHAAFFADCEHEVAPVRSGYRCCLVYNLRLDEGDPDSLNLSLDAHAQTLLDPLRALKDERRGDLAALLLEHYYTEANFSLRNLKGHDAARARALFAAAKETGFTARLGLVTYHQTGELVESYRPRRRYRNDDEGDDPEDGTMGEIHEEGRTIELWRDENDNEVPLGDYFVEEDVIFSREPFGEGEPDEKEAEGFTGNAGCTMDYWYRRAAIVLWAQDDEEEVLCCYDFRGACRTLAGLASTEKTGPGSSFHRLGIAVIRQLPDELPPAGHFSRLRSPENGPFAITLGALAQARSRGLLDELLPMLPDHAWALCDAALWKKLHKAFGVAAFAAIYERMSGGDPEVKRQLLFPILDALLAGKDGEPQARNIAVRLSALKPKAPQPPHWERKLEPLVPGDCEEACVLLAASRLLDGRAERSAALDFLLADRSLDYVRQVLAPALLDKRSCLSATNSLAPEVLDFARDLLADEVARPLAPYPDWTRPCPVLESPPHKTGSGFYHPGATAREALRELVAFMANPATEKRDFRYSQDIRSALEHFINDHALDLDCVTIRKGSPHTLACTKNDKSHHRALARRAADVELLEQLAGL